MPLSSVTAVDVVTPAIVPGTTITEFFGNVATQDGKLSACHVKITEAVSNPWQTPEFSEYILMLQGVANVEHKGGTTTVRSGEGVFLPAGCRVRWIFPGPAEYVPICLPAFSPDIVHREEGETTPAAPAHATSSEPVLVSPVDVVKAPKLTITEFFGNVASKDRHISACVAKVDEPCSEAWQKPIFAEWVLVLSGVLHLETAAGIAEVKAGSGIFLPAEERVKWIWPEACTYVPICMPAFTPEGCQREPEEGSAKDVDPQTMERLKEFHAVSAK